MTITEAQKRANAKWNKSNTKNLTLTLTKNNFNLFDKFAAVDGKSNVEKLKNLLECWYQKKENTV